jgi:hypothetical protein
MTTQVTTQKTYVLDGTLLEACSCQAPYAKMKEVSGVRYEIDRPERPGA